MTGRQKKIYAALLTILALILLFELIRNSGRDGDFAGYVNAGSLLLKGQNIYSDPYNTWPPFFSIFSVILTLGNKLSYFFIRFIWIFGSMVAMFIVIRLTYKMTFDKLPGLSLFNAGNKKKITIMEPLVLVPLLFIFRFLLDNFDNVQINIYMLLLAFLSLYYFIRNKPVLAALILAFSISLKVYTIFLLFYFLFKREFKMVLWTTLFILLINSVSFLVFGFHKAIEYYSYWYTQIASPPPTIQHKNQSLFGMMLRFFTGANPGRDFYVNVLSLNAANVKKYTYMLILLVSVYPAFLLRKKLTSRSSIKALLEYSFILTAIPLITPLAWKPYFVFLWYAYVLLFAFLFKSENTLNKRLLSVLKFFYFFSVFLNVFSSEIFVGRYISDIMETYSCISFGALILVIIQLVIYQNLHKFDLQALKSQETDIRNFRNF